jgi:hypothetical protein
MGWYSGCQTVLPRARTSLCREVRRGNCRDNAASKPWRVGLELCDVLVRHDLSMSLSAFSREVTSTLSVSLLTIIMEGVPVCPLVNQSPVWLKTSLSRVAGSAAA